jgi:hypothetical protein
MQIRRLDIPERKEIDEKSTMILSMFTLGGSKKYIQEKKSSAMFIAITPFQKLLNYN